MGLQEITRDNDEKRERRLSLFLREAFPMQDRFGFRNDAVPFVVCRLAALVAQSDASCLCFNCPSVVYRRWNRTARAGSGSKIAFRFAPAD